MFKTSFAKNIFQNKYAIDKDDTWERLAHRLVDDVCGTFRNTQLALMKKNDRDQLEQYIKDMKFIPGGRYLYYAGRDYHAWNNCYLLKAEEDTREEWSNLLNKSSHCLMSGGGIGIDYSIIRPRGSSLRRSGGLASGPIPIMKTINELGRNVMQGGSRRSAIYASLNWQHKDIDEFLTVKNWKDIKIGNSKITVAEVKFEDFNFHAPLDYTNISVNYDNKFLEQKNCEVFQKNVYQALSTGEPGFSFNFGDRENETLRNACTEVTSEDDSDVCNLGSINLAAIESLDELHDVTYLASQFLVCGTMRAELPYKKVYEIREKNRRLGLGIMGVHEWLLRKNYKYFFVNELKEWLNVWKGISKKAADVLCNALGISKPVAYRAIAPTGTIGILAATTTGIEPLYAVAFKRRYLADNKHKYEYVIDATAEYLVQQGINPESIESSIDLVSDPERRINFQAEIQEYVDHAISSTINLPPWGSELNNEDTVKPFTKLIRKYAPALRGLTFYPDGSRGGQPLTSVPYAEAHKHKGVIFEEQDVCLLTGKGGVCGV